MSSPAVFQVPFLLFWFFVVRGILGRSLRANYPEQRLFVVYNWPASRSTGPTSNFTLLGFAGSNESLLEWKLKVFDLRSLSQIYSSSGEWSGV
jgi:hypothetical protein